MGALGYIYTILVAAILAAGGQYLIARQVTLTRNTVALFVLGFIGAFAGSEFFGPIEITEAGKSKEIIGPLSQIGADYFAFGGFNFLTGIVGGLILTGAAVYGMRRAAAGQSTDIASEGIRDPRLAHLLFSDSRAAALWLGVRLYIGYEWLNAGLHKVTDDRWVGGGAALRGYWERAIAEPAPPARAAITYDWYRDFLRFLLDNDTYTWFAKLVAWGELLVGLGLIVGCLVGFAAFFGALMNFNFMLAGTASTNPLLFAVAVALILAWKVAGYYGVDRYLLPALGAPWSPGKIFRHRPASGPQPA